MIGNAQGIEIYYDADKKNPNTVFLSGGRVAHYHTGGMLFQLIGDETVYMMSEKVKNMVKTYPGYNDSLSIDSIEECFRHWLYYAVDEDEAPIAAELFRSSFTESICRILEDEDAMRSCSTIGEFMTVCCEDYLSYIRAFALFFDALAADASGTADEFQTAIADEFKSSADEMFDLYSKKCSLQHKEGHVLIQTHRITNPIQLLTFEYCRLKKSGKSVKICQNCGRYFIPPKRNDAIFCPMPSPQNPERTCQKIGPQVRRTAKRQSDSEELEHHRVVSKQYMTIMRHKEKGEDENSYTVKYCRDILRKEKERYQNAIAANGEGDEQNG